MSDNNNNNITGELATAQKAAKKDLVYLNPCSILFSLWPL